MQTSAIGSGDGPGLEGAPAHGGVSEAAEALTGVMTWLRRAVRPAEWNAIALSTLDAVDRSGPHRISFLVSQERITQPGMTGLIDRLAAAGLVQRQPDPADGRAALVAITAAGHDYVAGLRRRRARALSAHIAQLEPAQQQALGRAAGALQSLAVLPVRDLSDSRDSDISDAK